MTQTAREPLTVVTAAVLREHREALEQMAARDDRTVSYLVRCAVLEYLHSGTGVTGDVSRGASPDDRKTAWRAFLRSSSEDRPDEAAIRERRVELARRNHHWTELRETDLVRRGRVLVHADSDDVFTFYRGAIFEPGSGSILFNESVPLSFYVDRAGEPVFLERKPTTWSEIVAKRAKRGR